MRVFVANASIIIASRNFSLHGRFSRIRTMPLNESRSFKGLRRPKPKCPRNRSSLLDISLPSHRPLVKFALTFMRSFSMMQIVPRTHLCSAVQWRRKSRPFAPIYFVCVYITNPAIHRPCIGPYLCRCFGRIVPWVAIIVLSLHEP